jgi:hypothetical protein
MEHRLRDGAVSHHDGVNGAPPGQQRAGEDQGIAAVVARAHHRNDRPIGVQALKKLRGRPAGVLHEDRLWNPQ